MVRALPLSLLRNAVLVLPNLKAHKNIKELRKFPEAPCILNSILSSPTEKPSNMKISGNTFIVTGG